MSDTKSLRIKRGNRLSATSFAIVVFIIAGGSFTDTASYMGGGVLFEHPAYLNYAFLTIFGYYFFKYWLVSKGTLSSFFKIIYTRNRNSTSFKKYISSKAEEIFSRKIKSGEELFGKVWEPNDRNKPVKARPATHSRHTPLIKKGFKKTSVKVYASNLSGSTTAYNEKPIEIEIPTIMYVLFYMKAMLSFMFLDDRFSTEYYPYILSSIALLFLFYENFIV